MAAALFTRNQFPAAPIVLCRKHLEAGHTVRAVLVNSGNANAANGEPLSVKAKAYSMPGVTVDGGDPVAVHGVVSHAVARARSGGGPTLVESKVFRL